MKNEWNHTSDDSGEKTKNKVIEIIILSLISFQKQR